ncbi:GNAT family N-acetyltransferase [Flaviflexus huanghaiensis]|uniref:GNAT family N-acetyltransferase n=1 Tax=Flaviflexus huanghaiensis TaxID=1111473 RepID=UPI0019D61113|nr:GNAT family protein [Flaviflexus huanghaiensis]
MTVTLRPETRDDWPWLWHWRHEEEDPDWKRWDSPFLHEQTHTLTFSEFTMRRGLNARLGAIIEHDGRPVGYVTRGELAPLGGGWWDWGIVIFDPADRRNGVGTRAGRLWIDDTFRRTNAHVLTLTTWSGNDAMIATGESLGFVECTRIPEARLWQGTRYDSVQMAMLRRDWSFEPRH